MAHNRIRTLSRRYYGKDRKYKITYYDVYGNGFCKIMECMRHGVYEVLGHVNWDYRW